MTSVDTVSDKPATKMSCKGFLHKTTTKAANSASAFLEQHKEWLRTGEIAKVTEPILMNLSVGAILPTPALQEIKLAVFNHMVKMDALKAEKAIEEAQNPTEKSSNKNHIVIIYDDRGRIATKLNAEGKPVDMIRGFDLPQEGWRWSANRLVTDGGPGWYATIDHIQTGLHQETMDRDQAMAIIFPRQKSAICKKRPQTTSRLKFGVKAKQDTCHFSRG